MGVTVPEIMILAGAGYGAVMAAQASRRIHASRSWPSITGKIFRSEIVGGWESAASGNLEYMYKPDIRYEYFINGQRYEGNSVRYKTVSASGESLLEDPKRQFPVGREVEVFFNPNKPSESILATARPPFYILSGLFLISIFLIILVFVGAAEKWKWLN